MLQALAFWRWLNHVYSEASAPLVLNMDETSIAFKPPPGLGTVQKGCQAVAPASLAETRSCFSLMCTICADTQVQPCLPQILLSNGRILGKKPKLEILKGNLVVWTQKSAWTCHGTLRRYMALLGSRLSAAAPGRDYILLLDCAPSHVHTSIRTQAKLNRIRLVYIAAGLTRCLQPADTELFSQLKRKFSELYCLEQTKTLDGRVAASQWLQVVSLALLAVLPAVKWSHAFRRVGALNLQKDVSASLLKEFGWSALPDIPSGPPTELEARELFPKGRSKLDVMSYVLWKEPARFHKGKPVRTLD